MLTEEQKAKAVELKAEMATKAGRAAVVELKKEVRRGGATARELATVLGLHESTLCRWEREVRASGGAKRRKRQSGQGESMFRVVQVAAPERRSVQSACAPGPSGGSLRAAHTPSGLVIDGLDVETLVVLLQRVSCSSAR